MKDIGIEYLYKKLSSALVIVKFFARITMESIRLVKLTVGACQVPLLILLVLTGLEINKVRNEKETLQLYRQQQHAPKEMEKQIKDLDFEFGLFITIASLMTIEIIFTSIALIGNRFGFLLTASIFNLLIPGCYVALIRIFKGQMYLAESIIGAIVTFIILVPTYC